MLLLLLLSIRFAADSTALPLRSAKTLPRPAQPFEDAARPSGGKERDSAALIPSTTSPELDDSTRLLGACMTQRICYCTTVDSRLVNRSFLERTSPTGISVHDAPCSSRGAECGISH